MDDGDLTNTLGKGLHIAHQNVRSLLGKNKVDMLNLQIKDSNIDVFTVSESWLTPAIPNSQIEVQNYSVSRVDRSWGINGKGDPKRGGGVLCYIKEGIKFSEDKFRELNESNAVASTLIS